MFNAVCSDRASLSFARGAKSDFVVATVGITMDDTGHNRYFSWERREQELQKVKMNTRQCLKRIIYIG
jgi:hypothetical protein